jgi:hypothetical protein
MASLICCQFDRSQIEAGDFSRFVSTWGLHKLPSGRALRGYLDRFSFRVHGYEDDQREVYEIPEVRGFFCSLNAVWPFWFFVCNLNAPDLQTITFCCLRRLRVLLRQKAPFCHVEYDPGELRRFVLPGFRGMNLLFERAGMTRAENQERSVRIIEYFHTDWRTQPLKSR